MFINMKIQWAFTLLGCIAVLLVPIPVYLYRNGGKMRENSHFAPTFSGPPALTDSDSDVSEEIEEEKDRAANGDA